MKKSSTKIMKYAATWNWLTTHDKRMYFIRKITKYEVLTMYVIHTTDVEICREGRNESAKIDDSKNISTIFDNTAKGLSVSMSFSPIIDFVVYYSATTAHNDLWKYIFPNHWIEAELPSDRHMAQTFFGISTCYFIQSSTLPERFFVVVVGFVFKTQFHFYSNASFLLLLF